MQSSRVEAEVPGQPWLEVVLMQNNKAYVGTGDISLPLKCSPFLGFATGRAVYGSRNFFTITSIVLSLLQGYRRWRLKSTVRRPLDKNHTAWWVHQKQVEANPLWKMILLPQTSEQTMVV